MSYSGLPASPGIDLSRTIFAGMSQPQLVAALASAQAALITLNGGAQVASATYQNGDSNKSVTYRAADRAALQGNVMILMRALGLGGPSRRPMVPFF